MSTVVIAAMGLYFTNVYNDRQSQRDLITESYQTRVLEMQTVEKFIPHLTGDEETKKVALIAINTLGSPEFATSFSKLYPSTGAESATSLIMATAQSPDQKEIPSPIIVSVPSKEVGGIKEGWAYIGQYVYSEKKWETTYIDFKSLKTEDGVDWLSGKTIQLSDSASKINVRSEMPTNSGKHSKIIDVLSPGSKAVIKEIKKWNSTGHIWAKIAYGTHRTITYESNYGISGTISLSLGSENVLYKKAGCGIKGGFDILKVIVHSDGTIQAYNKDCEDNSAILGARINEGCSKASYGEYYIECCTTDN